MVRARVETCLFPVAACPAKGLKSVCRADRRDHFRTTSGLHRHLLARGSAGDWSLSQEYVTHLGAFARPVLHYGYPIARSQLSHYGQYRRDLFTKWVGGTRSTLPSGAPPTGRSCSLKPRLARGASLGGPPPSTAAPHSRAPHPRPQGGRVRARTRTTPTLARGARHCDPAAHMCLCGLTASTRPLSEYSTFKRRTQQVAVGGGSWTRALVGPAPGVRDGARLGLAATRTTCRYRRPAGPEVGRS